MQRRREGRNECETVAAGKQSELERGKERGRLLSQMRLFKFHWRVSLSTPAESV